MYITVNTRFLSDNFGSSPLIFLMLRFFIPRARTEDYGY